MHRGSSAHTMTGTGAHPHRPGHGAPTWPRLHWRERAALTAEGVTRAEWERLPGTLRADLRATIPVAYPLDPLERRAWLRLTLRTAGDSIPPDHPRRVLERRNPLVIRAREAYRSRPPAEPHPSTADTLAAVGYVDGSWFFDGHSEPTPEADAEAAELAESVHQLAVASRRHATAVHALTGLILALVSALLEVRDAAPRIAPRRRCTDPPEPSPPQRALTSSTLTAAPPVTASPVPGPSCALTMAA